MHHGDGMSSAAPAVPETPTPPQEVELVCVKVGGKLRVRITSPNYLHAANVQFPRDIRQEGRRFRVPVSSISLVETRGKFFYTVRQRAAIHTLDAGSVATSTPESILAGLQVYEDEDSAECVICMSEPKSTVFLPCAHLYCCAGCAAKVHKCPICRQPVTRRIDKALIG